MPAILVLLLHIALRLLRAQIVYGRYYGSGII